MPLRKPVQNHQIYRMFKEQNVRSWAEMFGSGQIQAKIGLFKICHPGICHSSGGSRSDAAQGPAVSTAAAQQGVGRQRHSQAKSGLED